MAYCGPRGIPLSEFLRWEPQDQDAALAWSEHDAQRCPDCGTHPDEWDERRGGHRHAYVVDVKRCPGCERHELGSEHVQRLAKEGERGLHVVMRRNPQT